MTIRIFDSDWTFNSWPNKPRAWNVLVRKGGLRIRAKNPLIAEQVATNYRKADITPKQNAMLDFAMKVSRRSAAMGRAPR